MSISDILINTLAADANLRKNATLQLETAARENFPAYTVMLCQEMANDGAQAEVRTAAALALKNTMTARDDARRQMLADKWMSIEASTRQQIKQSVLLTLATPNNLVSNNVAQVVAAIAAIEVPLNQWPELINQLLENIMNSTDDSLRRATLKALGFVCESTNSAFLAAQSNQILTAVVRGACADEKNPDVRLAALNALNNSLEFVRDNFSREGERNYIMQVVCEATQCENDEVKVAAFETMVRIMDQYYGHMEVYMAEALFSLTVSGMHSEDERVALQAVEFWSTVYDEEIDLNRAMANQESYTQPEQPNLHFAEKGMTEVLPVLLLLLTKQEEDADEDEWNVSMAAATCLSLLAQCVGNNIVEPIIPFIERNIRSENWHEREAAIMAFGSILSGPDPIQLYPLVAQAFPVLIEMLKDPVVQVKDTAAWTLGRVCELQMESIDKSTQLHPLIAALIAGLEDSPKITANCCWSLINVATQLALLEEDEADSSLSPYFEGIVTALMRVGDRSDNEYNARTSAYEALSAYTTNAPIDCVPVVSTLTLGMLDRLETSFAMQGQIVSAEDRAAYVELQSNVCSVLTCSIRRLHNDILPISDRTMTILLQMLQSSSNHSSAVAEDVFLTIGALTSAIEGEFLRYMESFSPFLFSALQNRDEYQLCMIAIGLIGDVCRALGDKVAPFCNSFMELLMQTLQDSATTPQVRPQVLSCFGDIALAIGAGFEAYLTPVMLAISQACQIRAVSADQQEYVNALRDGILEAYIGITQGLKATNASSLLMPYVPDIIHFMHGVYVEKTWNASVLSNMVGLLGDLAEAFPNTQLREAFDAPWVLLCIRECRTSRNASPSEREVARWAREMVKRACA